MKMEMRLVIAEKTATMMVYKSFEQFKQFMDGSKGFVHYAGFLYPATPGFGECINNILFTYFVPEGTDNDIFYFHIIECAGITLGIMSIINYYKEKAEKAAADHGLFVQKGNFGMKINEKFFIKIVKDNGRMFVLNSTSSYLKNYNDPHKRLMFDEAEEKTIKFIGRVKKKGSNLLANDWGKLVS